MASGESDLKIKAGVEGVDEIAAGASKALSPWQQKAKEVGKAVQGAFSGALSDIARTITVANTISFGQALESARKYREEVGRLSAVDGPVAELRKNIADVGRAHLIGDSEFISAERGLGRMIYNFKGARGALGDLQDEALATGETLNDKLPLGATLMNSMGVASEGVGSELGRIRAIADEFNQPLLVAEDRLKGMNSLLVEIGATTDADRGKAEALAIGLGKNLKSPEAGARAATGILSLMSSQRRDLERNAGMKTGALTNEDGSLNIDKAVEAADKLRNRILKTSGGDKGLAQLRAANLFGGDYQTAAAFMSGDLKSIMATGANAKPSTKTAEEAAAFKNSDAGQAILRKQEMDRNARDAAENALPLADAYQDLFASHPLLTTLGTGAAGKLAPGLLGKAGGWIGSQLGITGGTAAGGGAATGVGADTAVLTGAGMTPAGIAMLGAGGMAANMAYAGKVMTDIHEATKGTSREFQSQFRSQRRHDAELVVKAAGTMPQSPEDFVRALGPGLTARSDYDPSLGAVRAGLEQGNLDLSTLPDDVRKGVEDGMKDLPDKIRVALAGLITVQNNTDHPVAVNAQQHGKTSKN